MMMNLGDLTLKHNSKALHKINQKLMTKELLKHIDFVEKATSDVEDTSKLNNKT